MLGLSLIYKQLYLFSSLLYKLNFRSRYQPPINSIGVGNISIGGTGKTPMTYLIAERASNKNHKVGIISRGYLRLNNTNSTDDEDILSLHPVNNVKRFVNSNKIKATKTAIAEFNPDILIYDDSFQSKYLKLRHNLLMLDCLEPPFDKKLLPAGPLRSPLDEMKNADAIVLLNSESVFSVVLDRIKLKLNSFLPKERIFEANYYINGLYKYKQGICQLNEIKDLKVFAFCGIGNPASFSRTVQKSGAKLSAFRDFPDHFRYTKLVLDELEKKAKDSEIDALLTTEKDLLRIASINYNHSIPIYALSIILKMANEDSDKLFSIFEL